MQQFSDSLSLAEANDHIWMQSYALDGIARAQHGLGEERAAWRSWRQSLTVAARDGHQGLIMNVLSTGATLYATYGDPARALELATLVVESPVTWRESRDRAADVLSRTLLHIDEDTAAAAQERGLHLQLEAVLEKELSGDTE